MRQLAVDVTMIVSANGTSATLNQVKNALGDDITDSFRAYAKRIGETLTTSESIERTAGDYAKEFESSLP